MQGNSLVFAHASLRAVRGALGPRRRHQRARAEFLAGDPEKRREIARALGVRYVVTEGQVYIEVNPLLAYQQPTYQQPAPAGSERQPVPAPPGWKGDWTGQEKAMFEPLENDSESTKKTLSGERVLHGWG